MARARASWARLAGALFVGALLWLWSGPALAQVGAPASWPREYLRIGAYGGAGYANERLAHAKGAYGAGNVVISAYPWLGLTVGLSGEMFSYYERKYPTTLPSPDGSSGLVVHPSERLPRLRYSLGYEFLQHVLRDRELARVTPYLVGQYASFVNPILPQRASALGAGIQGELRLHEGLRVLADLSYVQVVQLSDPNVQHLLLLGTFTGNVRFCVGAAFAIGRSARLEVRYQGELFYYQHAQRTLDTLLFGPTFHLR